MLFESKTQAVIDQIKSGRGAADADTWQAIKETAEAWKPNGFDSIQQQLRALYEGDIEGDTLEAAKVRFPLTAHRMPMVALNWARLHSENGASVYDWPAKRVLERVDANGQAETLDRDSPGPDGQRARDFDDMLAEALIDPVMAEAERRTELAKTIFLRVASDGVEAVATGKPPKTKVTAFWPGDVLVIPHPSSPASLSAAVAVIVKVASSDGTRSSARTYEMWSRSFEDDPQGLPLSFSAWKLQRITERKKDGEKAKVTIEEIQWRMPGGGTSAVYPLPTLPWVAWHDGIVDGSPYMEPARNLLPLFRTANVSLMAEQYASDMNSATPVIRKTNAVRPTTIALGPGLMPAIPLEDDIQAVAMGADFQGMRSVNKALLGAIALTSRQRIEGYDTDASAQPVSGVALKIKGEPQAKARLESVARAISVEAQLLPIMIEVHDFFRGTSIAEDGIRPVMRPTDPPEYEERSQTVDRLVRLRDAGLATDAEVRVGAGMSRTLEEAQAVIDQIREEREARTPDRLKALMSGGMPDMESDPKEAPEPDLEDSTEEG